MKTEINNFPVKGYVAEGFEPVHGAFTANFSDGLEAGTGFCVYKDGELVVDLIGGTKDRRSAEAWQVDTLVPVFSTTKAVAALVIAWLVEQGRLDYEQTVASLWPDFAAHGKGALTVAQVLSHQAGLSGITDPMQPEDWFDWDGICARLAAQEPIWPPGTKSGYHPLTFGFLAGEIARLADSENRTLGTILREEICAPHDIDFFIGTPKSEHERCAVLHKPKAMANFGEINPATKAAFLRPWSSPGRRGTEAWRTAEFAGANGHGTAKSIARLMQLALDGHIGEIKYLPINNRELTGDKTIKFTITSVNNELEAGFGETGINGRFHTVTLIDDDCLVDLRKFEGKWEFDQNDGEFVYEVEILVDWSSNNRIFMLGYTGLDSSLFAFANLNLCSGEFDIPEQLLAGTSQLENTRSEGKGSFDSEVELLTFSYTYDIAGPTIRTVRAKKKKE
ncbi:MAG: beta-lactamase family protein [Robiginitomaculum sp.]|nr:beta-lactamase family protein [Robiginitomaculum sp.]